MDNLVKSYYSFHNSTLSPNVFLDIPRLVERGYVLTPDIISTLRAIFENRLKIKAIIFWVRVRPFAEFIILVLENVLLQGLELYLLHTTDFRLFCSSEIAREVKKFIREEWSILFPEYRAASIYSYTKNFMLNKLCGFRYTGEIRPRGDESYFLFKAR